MLDQGTIRRVINFDGPVPIWRQIEAILRERVAAGTYPPGHAIPSLMKLTAEFGVAEVTVRKAVGVALRREPRTALIDRQSLQARRRGGRAAASSTITPSQCRLSK